jgi:ABC-type nitrate/sulfonate/bicarbonate transport system substrate-binding protein
MKNWYLSVSLLIGLAGVVPELSTAADKIRISVTNFNMSFLPSGLAVRRGFFKEEGIEAEVIRMNANVAITALASGDGNIPDDGLLAVIDQAVKESKPNRPIGANDVADMTALREAQKELGIKGK